MKSNSFEGSPAEEYLRLHWDESNLRFDGNKHVAYCKYCYTIHDNWMLSHDHAAPMCWECGHCNHFSADDHLQIYDLVPLEDKENQE